MVCVFVFDSKRTSFLRIRRRENGEHASVYRFVQSLCERLHMCGRLQLSVCSSVLPVQVGPTTCRSLSNTGTFGPVAQRLHGPQFSFARGAGVRPILHATSDQQQARQGKQEHLLYGPRITSSATTALFSHPMYVDADVESTFNLTSWPKRANILNL